MTDFTNKRPRLRNVAPRNWIFDTVDVSRMPESLAELSDDLRLRKVLKQAVLREEAPQHLVDSIRKAIRG
jgi:hypothetical protein